MRSSCRSSRAASALALTVLIGGGAEVWAHRLDEYLQAARLAIGPDRVQIELDLTPGIALAEGVLSVIDRNRDGSLSAEEQHAYGVRVLGALDLDVDGTPLTLRLGQLGTSTFPGVDAVKRGEGTIRLQAAAALPPQSIGVHLLSFRNRYHPDRSVYLANALVPESPRVGLMEQRRDGDQRELAIEYLIRPAPATPRGLLLGSIAAAAVLSVLLIAILAIRPAKRGQAR